MAGYTGGQLLCSVMPSQQPEHAYASALFLAARYNETLDVVGRLAGEPATTLLRARALYRLKRNHEALELLNAVHWPTFPRDTAIEGACVTALVHIAIGNAREASALLDVISELQLRATTEDLRCEVFHTRALLYWSTGALQRATVTIRDAERGAPPHWLGKLLILRGWIAASQNQFAEQARLLHRGMQELRKGAVLDVGVMARALHGLAGIVREIVAPDLVDAAIDLAGHLPWTDDLRVERMQTLRGIGWARMLRGEYIAGIRDINRIKVIAPDERWRVIAHLDHAYMARLQGETGTSQAELLDADELIRTVNWSDSRGEELVALLIAAELFATLNPGRSRELFAKYDAVKGGMSPMIGFKHNARLDAMEAYVRAAIAHTGGDYRAALSHAATAFRAFSSMNHDWRAARAALLAHANGGGTQFLEHATEATLAYPRSFIALEIEKKRERNERPMLAKLTPRERDVFDLLCSGASALDCARDLAMSESTVRGHIQKIHRKFGVASRAALLAAAARQGFIAPQAV